MVTVLSLLAAPVFAYGDRTVAMATIIFQYSRMYVRFICELNVYLSYCSLLSQIWLNKDDQSYISYCQDLLQNTSSESILMTRINCIPVEVFKLPNKLNALCLHDMFKINDTPYDIRATNLEQPLRRTTNYGLGAYTYIGCRLWNLLIQECPEVHRMDLGQFKSLLELWNGPICDVSEMQLL